MKINGIIYQVIIEEENPITENMVCSCGFWKDFLRERNLQAREPSKIQREESNEDQLHGSKARAQRTKLRLVTQ